MMSPFSRLSYSFSLRADTFSEVSSSLTFSPSYRKRTVLMSNYTPELVKPRYAHSAAVGLHEFLERGVALDLEEDLVSVLREKERKAGTVPATSP